MKNPLKLVASIVIAELAGGIGSIFTTPSIATWFDTLNKPHLAPPNWVFGPVWTTLFVLMGTAAFLVWKRGFYRKDVKVALGIYAIQLVLNVFWSILFFGMHSPGLALAEISLLWISILVTIITFARISRSTTILLIPYIAWVSFAAYLNYAIWTLN